MKDVILALMITALASCGSRDSGSDDALPLQIQEEDSNVLAGTTWQTDCEDSSVNAVAFEQSSVHRKVYLYADAKCNTPDATVTIERTYNVSGQNIDYVLESVTFTLVTQKNVDDCNKDKCYGIDDWVLNIAREVTGKNFGDDDGTFIPEAGDKLFTIFLIDDDALYFGDTSKDNQHGTTAFTRPEDIDYNLPRFYKVP